MRLWIITVSKRYPPLNPARVNAPVDVNRLWTQARIESVLIALRERLALRRGAAASRPRCLSSIGYLAGN